MMKRARRPIGITIASSLVAVCLFAGGLASPARAASGPRVTPLPGKAGGILHLAQREELASGFAIHETATIATVWPASPCFSNLDQQSQELDRAKRAALVRQIQAKLEQDGARPTMGWRLDYFTHWQHVKNLVPHHGVYNWGRMQDVWLDK